MGVCLCVCVRVCVCVCGCGVSFGSVVSGVGPLSPVCLWGGVGVGVCLCVCVYVYVGVVFLLDQLCQE